MTDVQTLTEKDRAVIVILINFYYEEGGIRNRQIVADIDGLISRLSVKPEASVPAKEEAAKK